MPAITTSAPPVTTPETLTPETLGVVSQLTRDSGIRTDTTVYLLGAMVLIALFLWLKKK